MHTAQRTLKTLVASMVLGGTLLGAHPIHASPQDPTAAVSMVRGWDKIFPKSDKVTHRKVSFKNRYGITLVGDLYLPKNRASGPLPAIAVSGPFGAVKEQSSGLYAQTLAERGFVTLAFDPSYTGESGGLPRNTASPDINTEDFSAAVDFLGLLPEVHRNRIGILGVCGWGGFALNAALADPRIKAVATSTMYDMTRVMAQGYNDSTDTQARYTMKQQAADSRWHSAQQQYATLGDAAAHLPPPSALNADTPQFVREYSGFYKTPRGFHPRSVNSNSAWNTNNLLSFINMPILQRTAELRAPALVVHGEKAHSRYFSEDAFKALGSKNKELYIVPGASHVDLYDNQAGKIPFDKFEQFLKANLK